MHQFLTDRRVLAGVLLTTFLAISPLVLNQPTAMSLNDDWTQIFAFQAYLHDALLHHGELPQRSHMLGGGFPIIAHPEYPIFSPLTPTVLVFGPVLGTKVNVILLYLMGVLGMWLLCRRTLELDIGAAAWATLTLALTGWIPAILQSGNYPEIYFVVFPLLAHLVFEKKIVWGALIALTMILDGHLNSVACFLILGLWCVLQIAGDPTKRFEPIRSYAKTMLLTTGLAAYKLVPTIALLRIEDRSIDTYSSDAIEVGQAQWGEFLGTACRADGFALGPIPWILAIGGMCFFWRQTWRLAVAFWIAVLLWMGPNAPMDLFQWLHKIPVLSSIDSPAKYFVYFIGFFGVLLGARALTSIPTRWRTLSAVIATVGTALPLLIANTPVLSNVFTVPDEPAIQRPHVTVDTPFFRTGRWEGAAENRPDLYVYYRRGVSLVAWEDNFQLPTGVLADYFVTEDGILVSNDDFPGNAWVTDADGTVDLTTIRANHFTIDTEFSEKAAVQINQTYAKGWTCDNAIVGERDRRIELTVPAGNHTIRCAYSSQPFRLGLWITGLCLLSLVSWRWYRSRAVREQPAA